MIKLARELVQGLAIKHSRFIRYTLVGATGALLDFCVFVLLVKFTHINYLAVNAFSTTLGITNNFILNLKFNFQVNDKLWLRFISFYSVGLLGLLLKTGVLLLFVAVLGMGVIVAKALALILVLITQYNLNHLISFRKNARS